MYAHRLVAMAFLPNPKKLPQVCHEDDNPKNNNVSNLKWGTARYNVNHGLHNQHLSKSLSGRHLSKQTREAISIGRRREKIAQYTMDGKLICIWPCIAVAARRLSLNASNIGKGCRGVRVSTGGYMWKKTNQLYEAGQGVCNAIL